jgi:hypothetical protein
MNMRQKGTTVLTAEAHIQTERASAYLVALCRQLSEKAQARIDGQADIKWSEIDGIVDFGWGRCAMHAGPEALELRLEASDKTGLLSLQELFTRHLEHTGPTGGLQVSWQQARASSAEPNAQDRRDRMRHFHRRMRHSPHTE